jgi:hypothetical protein
MKCCKAFDLLIVSSSDGFIKGSSILLHCIFIVSVFFEIKNDLAILSSTFKVV